MKTENKHISEEDFRRYLEDKMSTTERNAFERELERHPFEAEALEGFQHISSGDLQKDLLELRERIRPKKRNLKLRYWAAAASVLIITATGIIWFNFDKSLSPPRIAENSAVEKTAGEFLSPEVKKESLPSENTDQSIHAEKKGKRSDEKRAASNNAAHPEQVTEPLAPEPESLPEMLVEDSESEELTFVEDAIEADILAEEIAVAARGSSRANDSNEIFVIGGLEQSMNVQPVTSEKNGMGRTTVTSNFNESIGAGSQNEITAFGADKNATPGQTIQMADAKARPVCGMETYEKYLESKAILPTDHPRNKEVVKVLVKINDIGAFTGFENLNQADSLLFEKAKEIIHNGPEWQPEISNGIQVYSEAKIKVTFKKAE